MEVFIMITIFVLGLFVGRFLYEIGVHTLHHKSKLYSSSQCPHCQNRFPIFDRIPVLSYLILNARCRYCGMKISVRYTLLEIITSILLVIAYVHLGFQWELLIAWIFISILMMITITDLLSKLIPNKITYPGICFFIVMRLFIHPLPYLDYVFGCILGSVLFYFIAILSRGGLGGGDIKLLALVGIVLGWKFTLVTIFLSSFIGLTISTILILFGIIKRKEPIPFGPYISLAAIISYFYGETIWNWYQHLYM